MGVLQAAARLRDALGALDFDAAAHVYNPLQYAWAPHAAYCDKFGQGTRRVVLVGMNPGPHGMGQTGVPFGDVGYVRDWMGISGEVAQPPRLHPKRPISGFDCTRREPSGSRLYGWASTRWGEAEAFFSQFFIVNHCPLLFFDEGGRNLTPPQLPRRAVADLMDECDAHLADVLRILAPGLAVGVGAYAEARVRGVVAAHDIDVEVGQVLHPSPASPAANRGWARQAEAQLAALGVAIPTAGAASL